ncbi:5283_t:CDS:2 [Rhizophagus irregularis]|nr:5283_t:CDS:2 [Rhizophagus irregularis]
MQLGRENIGIISKNAITIVHKLTIEKFIANLSDNFKKMTISDKDIFTSINTGTSGKGGNNNKKDKKN